MRQLFLTVAVCALFAVPANAYPGLPTPDAYKGRTKDAYTAANAYPELAQNLFCYCGCDREASHRHRKLLDCYLDEHAVSCGICQDEMIRAAGYKKQGMPVGLIAKKIDMEFQHNYPYGTPSAALKQYQAAHGTPVRNKKVARTQ